MSTKRKIMILLDCDTIKESPVFGTVTDEMIAERLKETLELMLTDTDIYPEEGDIFSLSNPTVIMNQEQLDSVHLVHPDDMLSTDEATILEDFKRLGTDPKWLKFEKRCRELENEGLTRSDAQDIAVGEGLAPISPTGFSIS